MAILALELWVREMAARLCQKKPSLFSFLNGSSIASWQRCHFWPPSPLGNSEGIIIGKREAVARQKKEEEENWHGLYDKSGDECLSIHCQQRQRRRRAKKHSLGIMPCYGDPCGHYHYYYGASSLLPPANPLDHANDLFLGSRGSVFNCRVERKHLPYGRAGLNLWSKKGFFKPIHRFPAHRKN